MTTIYFDKTAIDSLIDFRDKIFKLAQEAYQAHGIDILANDTLNALSIHEIVSSYDANYNTNFHRNNEDAKSGNTLIENKCTTKAPSKKGVIGNGGWQFHAQGKLNYSRYIFAIRRKDNLKIVRLYDISSPDAIVAVQQCLEEQKQKWINKGKPNHDAIMVPEKLFVNFDTTTEIISGCKVIKV